MARPKKKGFDFYSISNNIQSTIDMKRLYRVCGTQSLAVILEIWGRINQCGYYMKWEEDSAFFIGHELLLSEEYVNSVIEEAIKLNFFDEELFRNYGIVSSEEIQERFLNICKVSKRKCVIEEFNLINSDENDIISENTRVSSEKMGVISEKTIVISEKTPNKPGINSEKTGENKKEKEKINKKEIVDENNTLLTRAHTREGNESQATEPCVSSTTTNLNLNKSNFVVSSEKTKGEVVVDNRDVRVSSEKTPVFPENTLTSDGFKGELMDDIRAYARFLTLDCSLEWRKYVSAEFQVSVEMIDKEIRNFDTHCRMKSKKVKDENDFKQYFVNWLKKRIECAPKDKKPDDGFVWERRKRIAAIKNEIARQKQVCENINDAYNRGEWGRTEIVGWLRKFNLPENMPKEVERKALYDAFHIDKETIEQSKVEAI